MYSVGIMWNCPVTTSKQDTYPQKTPKRKWFITMHYTCLCNPCSLSTLYRCSLTTVAQVIQKRYHKSQAFSLKMPAVLQIALLKIFRCAVGVHFLSTIFLSIIGYNFFRFRCAENHTPGTLLTFNLGVWWCAICLACLKRQGLTCPFKNGVANWTHLFWSLANNALRSSFLGRKQDVILVSRKRSLSSTSMVTEFLEEDWVED